MVNCTSLTVQAIPNTCIQGTRYTRYPWEECLPGYEHPVDWWNGGGNCYCTADEEAKKKLDDSNNGEFNDWFSILQKYGIIIVIAIVFMMSLGRK